jgi:hypothetical protein
MVHLLWRLLQVDQVVLVLVLFPQSGLLVCCYITPLYFICFRFIIFVQGLYGTSLRVHISVSQDYFIVFKMISRAVREFVPALRFWADASCNESALVHL